MFPIVHHYANKLLHSQIHPFMVFGGIFPDLAINAGMNRDAAHEMGGDFYAWCLENAPIGLPLAKGIICHGNKPPGMDFFADEYWPGGEKGWCFQQGVPWMPKVKKATGLADNLIWWKAHNFIEMALELLVLEENPGLNLEILAALEDKTASVEVSNILRAYTKIPSQNFIAVFSRAGDIFALHKVSPETLAQKQAASLKRKGGTPDIPAMADLILEISLSLKSYYKPFLASAIGKVAETLKELPAGAKP